MNIEPPKQSAFLIFYAAKSTSYVFNL